MSVDWVCVGIAGYAEQQGAPSDLVDAEPTRRLESEASMCIKAECTVKLADTQACEHNTEVGPRQVAFAFAFALHGA